MRGSKSKRYIELSREQGKIALRHHKNTAAAIEGLLTIFDNWAGLSACNGCGQRDRKEPQAGASRGVGKVGRK